MKRIIALFLCVAMLLSVFPLSAFAIAVSRISYTSVDPEYYYQKDGYWETNDQGEDFYRYSIYYHTSDVLHVVWEDGSEADYTCVYNEDEERLEFRAESGEVISRDDVVIGDTQESTPWEIGENSYTISYGGASCEVVVTIKENIISEIVYTPKKDIVIYENTGGEWEEDAQGNKWYSYNIPSFQLGDMLEVTYSNGGSNIYFYMLDKDSGEYRFGDFDGYWLENTDELYTSYSGRWSTGGENVFYVMYFGVQSNPIPVSIVQSPLRSIEYIQAKPRACYINSGGSWDTDAHGERYYNYSYNNIEAGDVLKVTESDGTEVCYTAYFYDGYCYYFESEDGARIEEDEIQFYDKQYSEHFEPGDGNHYYLEYMGQQTSINLSVYTAEGIQYIPTDEFLHENYAYFEYGGEWDTDAQGNPFYRYPLPKFTAWDCLAITYSDGTQKEFYADSEYNSETGKRELKFVCYSDYSEFWASEVSFIDRQAEEPFTIGTNYYDISYLGQTTPIAFEVKPSFGAIKAIEYIPVQEKTYIENTNGTWDEDSSGNAFYRYDIPGFDEGDVMKVTLENGSVSTYTFASDCYAENADGDRLDINYLKTQRDEEVLWELGAANEYRVSYFGVFSNPIQVNIIKNPVQSIRYTPAKAPVYFENCNGYREYDWWEDEEFFHYHTPWRQLGDVLTIEDDKGVLTDYILEQAEDGDWYYRSAAGKQIRSDYVYFDDNQYDVHWKIGTQNAYTVTYREYTVTLYATVLENNVKNFTFVPAQPVEIDECTGGRLIEDDHLYLYDLPLHAADKLIITYEDETVEYVYNESQRQFLASDGRQPAGSEPEVYSTQNMEPWAPDRENYFYISYAGIEKEVPVTVRGSFATSVVEPTCTGWGYTVHTNADNTISYRSDYVPSLGHDYSLMIVSDEAKRTDADSGHGATYYYTCARCGALSKGDDDSWFTAGLGTIKAEVEIEYHGWLMTATLYKGEEVVSTIKFTESKTLLFNDLEPGNYTLKISCNTILPVEIENLALEENTVIDLTRSSRAALRKLQLARGDINDDGHVDIADVSVLLRSDVYGTDANSLESDVRSYWDLNNDEVINISDIAILLQEGNYLASAQKLEYQA